MLRSFRKLTFFSFVLLAGLVLSGCGTGDKRITSANPRVNDMRDRFLDKPANDGEIFRIFASSDSYASRQYGTEEGIRIKADPSGEEAFAEEIRQFDKIDLFTDAIFSIELFEETGSISRIRPVKPAKISELNKLIADDITRLKFEFPDGKIEPLKFNIRYGILLQKIATDQDIRDVLKENVR